MAVKIENPSAIRSTTWYPQYQETDVTVQLPANKYFMPTKRTNGIALTKILTKQTHVAALNEDVNNGLVPNNNTWATFGTAMAGVIKGDFTVVYNGQIASGQTVTLEYSNPAITTDEVLGEKGSAGLQVNFDPNGWSIKADVIEAGKIRVTASNFSGRSTTEPNATFFVKRYHSTAALGRGIYNYGMRTKSGVVSEFSENGYPITGVEDGYKEYYRLLKDNDPSIQSPADTNSFGDYFDPLNGYNVSLGFIGTAETPASLRDAISTKEKSQMRGLNPDGTRSVAYYFSRNSYAFRNRIVPGYQGGVTLQHNGTGIYNTIYNLMKSYNAAEDRRVGVFGWGPFEGINSIEDKGVNHRLPIPANGNQPAGDLIRLGFGESSFEMTLCHAFYAVLIGDTYMMWNDNAIYGTSVACTDEAFYGGASPGKTLWQPINGDTVQWNPQNSTHPSLQVDCPNPRRGFAVTPAENLNGAFTGIWLYSQIKNRSNIRLKFPTFSYTNNAGNQSGYANGSNNPVLGTKGDGSISTFGYSNPGNHTMVDSWEAKKPVVILCQGTDGYAITVVNPHAGLTETCNYSVTTPVGVVQVSVTGPAQAVFTV